jgi:hypothetical protein
VNCSNSRRYDGFIAYALFPWVGVVNCFNSKRYDGFIAYALFPWVGVVNCFNSKRYDGFIAYALFPWVGVVFFGLSLGWLFKSYRPLTVPIASMGVFFLLLFLVTRFILDWKIFNYRGWPRGEEDSPFKGVGMSYVLIVVGEAGPV